MQYLVPEALCFRGNASNKRLTSRYLVLLIGYVINGSKICEQYRQEKVQEYYYTNDHEGYEVETSCVTVLHRKVKHRLIVVFQGENLKYHKEAGVKGIKVQSSCRSIHVDCIV